MKIFRRPLLENSATAVVVIEMTEDEAGLLYSETCDTVEVDNDCPGEFNCADYCKNDHGTSPVLYLTPSIMTLHSGLEDLFPDGEDESS